MKAKRLEAEFSSHNTRPGYSLLLLRAHDAIALVSRAAEEGVPILGVDGFLLSEQGVQPSMEHSVDYSPSVSAGHGCWQAAETFIRKHRDVMSAFEVTLGDDPLEVV
jgi:hypothetical protein